MIKLGLMFAAGMIVGCVLTIVRATMFLMGSMKRVDSGWSQLEFDFDEDLTQTDDDPDVSGDVMVVACSMCSHPLVKPEDGAPYCERCDRK